MQPSYFVIQLLKDLPRNLFEYTLKANDIHPVLKLTTLKRKFLVTDAELVQIIDNNSQMFSETGKLGSEKKLKAIIGGDIPKNAMDYALDLNALDQVCSQRTNLLREWQHMADHNLTFDVKRQCHLLYLRLLNQLDFGLELGNSADDLVERFRKLRNNALRSTINIPRLPIIEAKLVYYLRKYRVDSLLKRLICQSGGKETPSHHQTQRLLTHMKAQMVYHFEFTATALNWAIHLLIEQPAWQEHLYDTVKNRPVKEVAQDSDHSLTLFILETLRLYPPFWLVERYTAKSFELGGYKIPGRSYVLISLYALHRHLKYWPQPNRFKPERFKRLEHIEPYTFMPFGLNSRQCPVQNQALTEIKAMLALLIQQFRFHKPAHHKSNLSGYFGLVPHPNYNIKVSAR